MHEGDDASDGDTTPADAVAEPVVPALPDEQLAVRMERLDVDDAGSELVDELIQQSLLEADASFIERRLLAFSARRMADEFFCLLASCCPGLERDGAAIAPIEWPRLRTREEPSPCAIDATCRHEIRSKASVPKGDTPPLTPCKSKRLLVATSLAASSLLSTSTSSLKSVGKSKPVAANPHASQPAPSGPIPGVPFSTAVAVPSASPRKTVAVLKAAVRLASSRSLRPESDANADETERSSDGDSDSHAGAAQSQHQRSSKDATSSPAPSAWSITLPRDPALVNEQETELATTVSVEESKEIASPPLARRDTFLRVADETEAVAVDPLGMLGFEMRDQLALSPGVKLQAEGGMAKSGPELPVVPSKMRRATFIDEALSPAAASPTRPQGRPSTTSVLLEASRPSEASGLDSQSSHSGVFSLTECAMTREDHSHNASMRSLAGSHASSVLSSSTASVKQNLFRKPSKVARPCTAAPAPPCCGGHSAAAPPNANEAFGELVKQRAFQRKPSLLNTSPPKRAQSRRSLVYSNSGNPSANGSSSPLSRRNLLCQTPASSSTTSPDDPLRHAASLM